MKLFGSEFVAVNRGGGRQGGQLWGDSPQSGGNPPLAELPDLVRAEHNHGFASIDPDGIYRSYHINSTVVDAARLTRAQLDTYLAAVDRVLGNERAEAERAHFTALLV
ncbi:hypothetical protein PG994_006700 [Apiospora phragmitis]|uniref:Uncharacterized protein n=1 Tax=Apiospora phragmitis TaxID=2905665 RepID=A0ABR1VJI8_9PEZI